MGGSTKDQEASTKERHGREIIPIGHGFSRGNRGQGRARPERPEGSMGERTVEVGARFERKGQHVHASVDMTPGTDRMAQGNERGAGG